jgi:hypothetical protein
MFLATHATAEEPARYSRAAARSYARTLQQWTRTLRVYDGWYGVLTADVTLVVSPLVAAQRAWTLASTGGGSEAVAHAPEGSTAVVLTAATLVKEDRPFDGDAPAWTLHLRVDGKDCGPATYASTRDPSPQQRALYPHITRWDTFWTATFACAAGEGNAVELAVDGPRGHAIARW